jgi:Ras-related protein Rab-1A
MSSLKKDFNKKIIVDVIRNPTFDAQFRGLPNNMDIDQDQNLSYGQDPGDKNRSLSDVELNITTYPLKLTLIGNSNVGKTAIIKRFITNKFDNKSMSTIAVNCQDKKIKIDPYTELNMQIWDTAGQERFRAIARGYLRESNGIFLVFDLTEQNSFDDLNLWLDEINNSDIDDKICVKMLIGNKFDCENKEVDETTAKNFAEENNMKYLNVSAKDGVNIISMFEIMGNACVNAIKEKEKNEIENKKDSSIISKKAKDANDSQSIRLKRHHNATKEKRCC